MAWMPEAIRKEIPRHNRSATSVRNRINYHVAVSEAASLYGYFSGASSCSHFYVRKDGTIEQYIDSQYFSRADYQGNDATISVETQGGVSNAQNEPWTDAQVASLARIAVWVHATHPSIPLAVAVDSRPGASSKGLSWHRLGIDPWRVGGGMRYSTSRGKICPGNAKIAQIPQIHAMATGGAIPAPAPAPAPVGNGGGVKNWLQEGDRGAGVLDLQRLLKARGYNLDLDGVFGPKTKAAVRSFQMAAGLVIDGLAGVATMAALRTPAPSRNYVQRGDSGAEVREIQSALRSRGYPIDVDGEFGPLTESAVKAFQRSAGLAVDGVAGAQTKAALAQVAVAPIPVPASNTGAVLRKGSSGEAVRVLQRRLNTNYPAYSRLTVDGLFGPGTEGVVKEFQRRSGLTADGIVGPITRKALGL